MFLFKLIRLEISERNEINVAHQNAADEVKLKIMYFFKSLVQGENILPPSLVILYPFKFRHIILGGSFRFWRLQIQIIKSMTFMFSKTLLGLGLCI